MAAEGERASTPVNLSAAVTAGLIAVGAWLLLHTLGLATGLIRTTVGDPESLRAVGFGGGLFAWLAPLLALFGGGLLVARTAPLPRFRDGLLHGALVWAVTSTLGVLAVAALAATLVGNARPVRGALVGQRGEDSVTALGLDLTELLAPTNARLRDQGAPPFTVQELRAAVADLVPAPSEPRRLERQAVVDRLATRLAPAEAQQIAGRLERRVDARLARLAEPPRDHATAGALLLLFLGLVAAVGGVAHGRALSRRAQARAAARQNEDGRRPPHEGARAADGGGLALPAPAQP